MPQIALLAIAAGISVGNLYWTQPLLALLATDFGVSAELAGLAVTMAQIGYAIGTFLLVPLGDALNRRGLIPLAMALEGGALIACSLTIGFPAFLLALLAVGGLAVSGQLIVPLSGDLASKAQRGKAVGIIASGILIGILAARSIGGLVAGLVGWRALFALAGIASLALGACLRSSLPDEGRRPKRPYAALLGSVISLPLAQRRVRVAMLFGALPMCVFTLLWTGATLLLAGRYGFPPSLIGAFGLLGIAGAFSGGISGPLADRGLSLQGLGASLAGLLLSLLLAAVSAGNLPMLGMAVIAFSACMQVALVLAQTRFMAIDPSARSRMNTVFVVGNFFAGSIGSTLAGLLWPQLGWPGLMALASLIILAAIAAWGLIRAGRLPE